MTGNSRDDASSCTPLRQQAEERLRLHRGDVSAMSLEQVQTLVHELQVHQIELQMQNEELLDTQQELLDTQQELLDTQRELAESRDRYFDLYELAPVGYVTIGPDYRIDRCNRTATELLGTERSKLKGAVLAALVAPEDRDTCFLALRQTLETGGRCTCECAIHCPAVDRRHVQIAIAPLVDETPGDGCRVTLTDITARKLAEEQQRESEFQLRLAVEASGIGYWDWDLQTDRVRFSSEWKQQIGYGDEEISDRFEEWQSRIHPEDVDCALQKVETYLATPRGRYESEFRFRHKNGNYRTILAVGRALPGPEGNLRRFVGCHIDITERKRTEQLLRDSERKYRVVADNNYDWEYWVDPQGRFIYCSPSCERITGHTAEEFLADPSLLETIIHPEDRDGYRKHAPHTRSDGESDEIRFRIIRPDGTQRWIGHVCQPVHDSSGACMGRRGSNRDITQQRQAEAALRGSEARFRAYVDQAPDAIIVHDALIQVRDANLQACTSLGYTRDELLRVSLPDVDSKFDLAAAQAICRQLTPGDFVTMDGQHRRKDGSTFPVEVRVSCFDLEGERNYIVLARDITEREQRTRELERTRNLLAEAQQIAHLGIWEYVAATQETVWSDEQKRIYGLDPSQPSPVYEEMLRHHIHPDDAAELDRRFRDALQDGKTFENEHRIVWPDGSVRFLYNKAQPYFDQSGDLVRYVGVTPDITEREEAEQALLRSNERLEDILEASRAGTWEWNVQSGETIFNARWAEIAGYTLEEISPTSVQTWIGLVHPDDLPACRAMQEDHFCGKLDYCDLKSRIRHKDGHWVWVRDRGRVIRWADDGQPLSMRGTHHDITPEKNAEAALHASEIRLRAYFEQAADALFVYDFSGRILDVNPHACASLGYSREELLRMDLRDVEVGLALDELQIGWRQIEPSKPWTVQGQHRRKDGVLFPVEVRIGCFDLEGERCYLALARDITDRVRRELELERVRNQLAEGQQIAHLGSWEYVAATQETVWSDEQKRIFGLDSHEPSPDYDDLFRDHIHPEDAAEWDRRFREAMKNSRTYEHEFRIIRSDGGVRYVRSKAQPSHDETGKLVRYVGVTLDITERREAEQELLRSKERLELAKRAAGQGVWDWNIPTGEFNWSPEIFTLFGLDVDADSPSFATWEAAMHPEDRAAARECVERALRDRTLFNTEYRVVHPDGKVRWIGGIGRASYDDAGHAVRMIGINMDVTERREMLEKMRQWNAELEKTVATRAAELRDANARLQATLSALPDLMFSLDREGRFEMYHAKDAAQLYVADSEFMGRKVTEVLPESASRIVMAALEEAAVNGLHRGAVYSLSLPQGPCWYELSVAPTKMPMDADSHFIALVRDITERKRLEDQLRSNEEKYRSLVENISECIWELDAQGRFTYLSPRFQELTGYSPAEFLGKTPASLIPEDEAPRLRAWEQSVGAGQTKIPPMEFRATRKDGQSYRVEVKGTIRHSSTGQVLGMRGIVLDVTERKQAEEMLKRFNEDLERQVQHRTAAIRMLRDVAAMANESQEPLQAADYCLKQLATQLGWSCGHVWWIDAEDERFLLPRCVWYPLDTVRWDEFRTLTLQSRLRCNAGLPGRAIAGGRPYWAIQLQRALIAPRAAVARKLGLATAVAVPVVARGKSVAVLEFFSDCQLPRDPGMIDILTGVALQLGRVIERREFEEHLLASTEDVRRGIAQDLHDDVGQELTGVSLLAAALSKLNPPATQPTIKLSADIAVALSRTHEKLRRLCHSAMPRELQEGNLIAAIMQLAAFTRDNSHIACEFACELPEEAEEAFDSRSSTQLYRIVQEAISNAIRHARARSIRIVLRQERGDLLLTIEDDGKGLPDGLPMNHGMGLQTMRYRAGMLDGTLEVGPGQGRGMRVVCRVPAAIRSSSTPTASKRSSRCRRKS